MTLSPFQPRRPGARRDLMPMAWFAVAALGVACGWLVGGAVGAPPFTDAGLAVAAALVAGVLGGWAAVGGAALGAFVAVLITGGDPSGGVWLAALAAALGSAGAAAIVWLIFSAAEGLSRGLATFRSHLWLLGAVAVSAVIGAPALAPALGIPFEPIALWAVAVDLLAAAAFVVPLVLLMVDRWGRRYRVELRGEGLADLLVALDLGGERLMASLDDQTAESTVVHTVSRREIGWGVLAHVATLVATTAAVLPLLGIADAHWPLYLYLVPILAAGAVYGVRGGVGAAALGGLLFFVGGLASGAIAAGGVGSLDLARVAFYLDFGVFGFLGGLVGTFRGTEAGLRRELAQRNRLLRRDLMRVVQALTAAVQAKDRYTEGHLRRVSEYAVTLGESLGLSGRELEMLHYASLLHDIGKIGVPERVLRKKGKLDANEEELMRAHAEIGAQILEGLDVLADAAPIVRHHQERYDGRTDATYPGYPDHLEGEEIPLGARIIAVVDAYDAMTTDRPYRRALTPSDACDELARQAGRQFDPEVVRAFLAILARRPWLPERAA